VTSDIEIGGPAALAPDYHLTLGSAAIDAGLTLAWVPFDFEGEARPLGGRVRRGADELPIVRVYFAVGACARRAEGTAVDGRASYNRSAREIVEETPMRVAIVLAALSRLMEVHDEDSGCL